jgi:hypothetical protein
LIGHNAERRAALEKAAMITIEIWRRADQLRRAEAGDAEVVVQSLRLDWTREGCFEGACAWFNIAQAIVRFRRD